MIEESDRPSAAYAYGSWLLGHAAESQRRQRIRVQLILTLAIAAMNLAGICVAMLLVTVAIPTPSVFSDAPSWVTTGVVPAGILIGLSLGAVWLTRRLVLALRWAIDGQQPSRVDERNTLLAPSRVAIAHLILWGCWTALSTTLYGLANISFIPRFLVSVSFCGIMVTTGAYLITEFALRPATSQVLQAGSLERPGIATTIMGRTMMVWLLASGLPIAGITLLAVFDMMLQDLTENQLAVAVLIASIQALIFGFILTCLLAWLTAGPVRVVRAALKRVEQGDLPGDLAVFDRTELGELQRGFNAMVEGLREREHVRDLFGRHVGREVAAAAERERPTLGGEERHVSVVFVDIVGSTKLVTSEAPADVVALLNRFFAIVVEEVDRHRGLVNKFQGDASLAIFGAPNRLDPPEAEALAAARAIAERLATEMPECLAGIGVSAGPVIAGNVGAKERFEYTVIGEPVNEAARLCELAKSRHVRLLASAQTVDGATENERTHWHLCEAVTLRGHDKPTRLATPIALYGPAESPLAHASPPQ
ncbi:adenylate/guanylate cyclase domain-containing protein [Mycobacterium simiae]|uniref:Adenylate/guanylate cyclase domain-containing protein n=1 Tax=Mycobacterium simiae TaxID=1784 RepID=A0A5B1BSC2_MYCSI|nr:adenylate/guanylate cyclase domain-containing protein [Mycobacterium simiae]KAA1251738.1 adenylate/guanylate cyclase domain-containing protein [Mycobacterium simiae]